MDRSLSGVLSFLALDALFKVKEQNKSKRLKQTLVIFQGKFKQYLSQLQYSKLLPRTTVGSRQLS